MADIIYITLSVETDDVLPSSLAILCLIMFFSMQAVLKNKGAYVDRQNWSKASQG